MRTVQVLGAASRIGRQYLRDKDGILDVIFDESKKLGGVYIKFLQQLATSEYAGEKLSSLTSNLDVYDKVASEELDISGLISAELGDRASEFKILNGGAPIAAGSFAQVYLADSSRLGKVIIKALRPSVDHNLATDLRLLWLFSHLINLISSDDFINAPKLANELIVATRKETNYPEEARSANYFKSYFEKRTNSVYVPKTYERYTTNKLLIQEYIDGISLADVIVKTQEGKNGKHYAYNQIRSDLYTQLENFGAELLCSLFFADIIMADPHPGNILLLPGGRVALIDFGQVAPAPSRRSVFYNMILQYRHIYENRADLSSLTIAMIAFYDYPLYNAMKTFAHSLGLTLESIRDMINRLVIPEEAYTSRHLAEHRWNSLFMQDINTNNQLGVQVSPDNITLQKAMRSYLTSIRLACPSLEDYNSIVYSAVVRAEDEARLKGVKETSRSKNDVTPDQAREIIIDWLSKVAERNEVFFNNLTKEFRV